MAIAHQLNLSIFAAMFLTTVLLESQPPLITNDAVVTGILCMILAFVFASSSSSNRFARRFYRVIPALLLCYFIPSILTTFNIISEEYSNLSHVAKRYLLPASLVLLTLSVDFKGILGLGPKAVIMFLTGTLGIIIGGPLALMVVSLISPDLLGGAGPEAVWRGLATIAGSWIGGGANMLAMKEIFDTSDDLYSIMVAVDVIVANIWMGFLLYGAGISTRIDRFFKADSSAIEDLKLRVEDYQRKVMKIPSLTDVMKVLGVGFGAVAFSHLFANFIAPLIADVAPGLDRFGLHKPFFWIVFGATTIGLILSFTRAKKLEGVGASRIGSVFIYFLVATIGMSMNIKAIFDQPVLFLVGLVWMLIHVTILLTVAKVIRAPFFFTAVGSQANVGGAASAPVVASAFHPSLATVGVLLAVLGYAVGTYGAWLCGIIMRLASGG